MSKKLFTLALMAGLASSLAFAGEKPKTKASADSTNTTMATDAAAKQDDAGAMKHKKKTQAPKPAATPEEKQFDEILRGIYG